MKDFLEKCLVIGFGFLLLMAATGVILGFCFAIAYPIARHSCAQDAKMLNTSYKFTLTGTCYIQQGNKYYPEDMLKHVTVGDEDFES